MNPKQATFLVAILVLLILAIFYANRATQLDPSLGPPSSPQALPGAERTPVR